MARAGRPACGTNLTERERHVLILLAHGHPKERISQYLRITESTIKTHALNIMARAGANDMASALLTICARGEIEIQPRPRMAVPEITGRTYAVLLNMTQGYRYQAIAKKLECTLQAVRYEAQKLYELLNIEHRTRVHLTFVALRTGIITINPREHRNEQ